MVDAEAVASGAINSREASRATTAIIIMNLAVEAVAGATTGAVEAEPSRARMRTAK